MKQIPGEFGDVLARRLVAAGKTGEELRERIVGSPARVTMTLLTPPNVEDGVSREQPYLVLTRHGVVGDKHSGPGRVGKHDDVLHVMAGVPKGTLRRNNRQVTIVSNYELRTIAEGMGLPSSTVPPGLLGENLRLETPLIPAFSAIGAVTAVVYAPDGEPRGAALSITSKNYPCGGPQAAISRRFGATYPGLRQFRRVAADMRGVLAEVLTPGPYERDGKAEDPTAEIHRGDYVVFFA